MNSARQQQIESTLIALHQDAKNDHLRMMKSAAKRIFRPMRPVDFKEVYLAISEEQGLALKQLIIDYQLRHIVEFGTSFGISTLYLAQGAIETQGHIVTTELVEYKAKKAMEHFKQAGVQELIDIRVGDAMQTLNNYEGPIDLLLLDGWKDLYLPLFQMLESHFHAHTVVYVDNADMAETRAFLDVVRQHPKYQLAPRHDGKVALITINQAYL